MSPVRPRSPAPNSSLLRSQLLCINVGLQILWGCEKPAKAHPEARYPSGKGEVCKTFMRRFDPDPRLQFPQAFRPIPKIAKDGLKWKMDRVPSLSNIRAGVAQW